VGEDESAPDTLRVLRIGAAAAAAPSEQLAVRLYAARLNAPPYSRVLLRCYAGASARALGERELAAHRAMRARLPQPTSFSPFEAGATGEGEAAVVALGGWFDAASLEGDAALWLVQRWTPLHTLEDYLVAPQAPPPATPAPPLPFPLRLFAEPAAAPAALAAAAAAVQAARRRRLFVADAALGCLTAVATLHSARVAHGALDSACFLFSTLDEAAYSAGDAPLPLVRLSNLGCSVVGFGPGGDADADGMDRAEELAEAAQRDCRALAACIASLIFTALGGGAGGGAGGRASAAAMRRLFLDVFAGDWAAARAYCEADADWEQACSLLSAEREAGWNGWALLALLLDGETYSADAQTILRVASRWRAAVAAAEGES